MQCIACTATYGSPAGQTWLLPRSRESEKERENSAVTLDLDEFSKIFQDSTVLTDGKQTSPCHCWLKVHLSYLNVL